MRETKDNKIKRLEKQIKEQHEEIKKINREKRKLANEIETLKKEMMVCYMGYTPYGDFDTSISVTWGNYCKERLLAFMKGEFSPPYNDWGGLFYDDELIIEINPLNGNITTSKQRNKIKERLNGNSEYIKVLKKIRNTLNFSERKPKETMRLGHSFLPLYVDVFFEDFLSENKWHKKYADLEYGTDKNGNIC